MLMHRYAEGGSLDFLDFQLGCLEAVWVPCFDPLGIKLLCSLVDMPEAKGTSERN